MLASHFTRFRSGYRNKTQNRPKPSMPSRSPMVPLGRERECSGDRGRSSRLKCVIRKTVHAQGDDEGHRDQPGQPQTDMMESVPGRRLWAGVKLPRMVEEMPVREVMIIAVDSRIGPTMEPFPMADSASTLNKRCLENWCVLRQC